MDILLEVRENVVVVEKQQGVHVCISGCPEVSNIYYCVPMFSHLGSGDKNIFEFWIMAPRPT